MLTAACCVLQEADVLLHVVDVSHPQAAKQADTVFRILDDLAVDADIPMVTVWNKIDLRADADVVRAVADNRPDTVAVSGETGEGIADLEVTIEAALEEAMVQFEMAVPYDQGHLVRLVREQVRRGRLELIAWLRSAPKAIPKQRGYCDVWKNRPPFSHWWLTG